MIRTKLTGGPALVRKVKKIGAGLADDLEVAVQAGALLIENRAKELAPVLTGTLRRSLHHETVEKTSDRVVVAVGTDLVYAPYVEDGTSRMAARPYLRPAFDETNGDARREMVRILRMRLQRM